MNYENKEDVVAIVGEIEKLQALFEELNEDWLVTTIKLDGKEIFAAVCSSKQSKENYFTEVSASFVVHLRMNIAAKIESLKNKLLKL